MEGTYCGKLCEECQYKEMLQCPGCKEGPGKAWNCECELAKCCRDKGHQNCTTCSYSTSCGKLRGRNNEPEQRLRKREDEIEKKKMIEGKAVFLGKWLWILFWLIIPSTVAGIMTNENLVAVLPGLNLPGQILQVAALLLYGGVLIKIACEDERYKTAGVCCLISAGVSVLVTILSYGKETPGWTLLFTIPAMIVSLVGEYNEYSARAEVAGDVSPELFDKWTNLWKWFIGMTLGLLGSIVLMLIIPILGLIVALVTAIGTVVVSILKLVYLYRTAKTFREYSGSV